MKSIVFFNNKGGVGKTTLVYHFSFMLAELGYKVLTVDLDPQMNLTSMFLTEERLEEIFEKEEAKPTLYNALIPLIEGTGDIRAVHIEPVNHHLSLVVGDLRLSTFEDRLSDSWGKCLDSDGAAFRIVSSFSRIIQAAGKAAGADFVIIDVGPNLGAINRSILISSDYLIIPVAADLFSLQGIKNLGGTLARWKKQWADRKERYTEIEKNMENPIALPNGEVRALGYVMMQHNAREGRPIKAYMNWANRIPRAFREFVLTQTDQIPENMHEDVYCLGMLRHYHSLMPMAMEVHKPVFLLKPADGAIGAHYQAVQSVYQEFKSLTQSIVQRIIISDTSCNPEGSNKI